MTNEHFNRIREAYIQRYPHLKHITDKRRFAYNALTLKSPAGVIDHWKFAHPKDLPIITYEIRR